MKTVNMKELPLSERPYEKCLKSGTESLTDAELLAVILRTGTSGQTSVQLAQNILKLCGTNGGLTGIHHISLAELQKINGVGQVKAIQIKAVGELAKRMAQQQARPALIFSQPCTIAEYYMEQLRHEEQEVLICMMLDTKNRLLGERMIFRGTVNASLVSPREVFLEALRSQAVHIILVHNHPSGDPSPSENDILITKRIAQSGELLGVCLLDHIVIGDQRYVSFREKKLL